MKHDFLAKSDLLPSLSTVEYSSAYLLSYSMICKYACVNTRKSRASIQEKLNQKRDEDGASFQSYTACSSQDSSVTHLHTVKVYNARPVSLTIEALFIKILLFLTTKVITCSKVINAFKRQKSSTDPFRKTARHLSHQYFLSFLCMAFVTPPILSPGSTDSARNAWDHNSFFGAHTRKQKETHAFILRVSQLKQARLISAVEKGQMNEVER